MGNMKLLLVEDNEQDQKICGNAVKDFNSDNPEANISLEICCCVNEAESKLKDECFDGIIIDMKLSSEKSDEGNQVIQELKKMLSRIPVVIMTGTPDVAEREDFPLVSIYRKGEVEYLELIKEFWHIYRTGLTKIMGGRGTIEEKLTTIFIDNLLPILKNNLSEQNSWIGYAKTDSDRTEKALLRYALNHLIHHLDNDISRCYPEEMYIYPPMNSRINTGSILKHNNSEQHYIVMNPACDLAERTNGRCKTDRALLVEIQTIESIFPNFDWKKLSKNNINILKETYRNNKELYYHWLPKTFFYSGGVVNFRRISTYTEDEISNLFSSPIAQISPPFLKDIVSRFSSYYARQGQPDIDVNIDMN